MKRDPSPRGWLVLVVIGAVAIGALGFLGGRLVRSPADRLADAKPPEASTLTVTVRSGSLDRETHAAGVVFWPSKVTLPAPTPTDGLSPVITATPIAAGEQVSAGQVLVEVAYRPVVVLPGRIPLLRDLRRGDQGKDVEALQTALRATGYPVADADGQFGPSTVRAMRDLYDAIDYEPPTDVDASAAELAFVDPLPARLLPGIAALGTPAAETLATLAAGDPVVRARVAPEDAATLRRDDGARVRLPGGAKSVGATVVDRGTEANSEEDGIYIPIRLKPTRPLTSRWVGAKVDITFPNRDAARGLLVPISAVFTSAARGTGVRRADGGRYVVVPVRVVGTASGTALVKPRRGAQLSVGDKVVIGIKP